MKKLFVLFVLAVLALSALPNALAQEVVAEEDVQTDPKAREEGNAMKAAKVNLPGIKGEIMKDAMKPIATKEKGFDSNVLKQKYDEKKNIAFNAIKSIKENGIEKADPSKVDMAIDFWIAASERVLDKLGAIAERRQNIQKPTEEIEEAITVIEDNLAELREISLDGVEKEELKLIKEHIKNINEALRSAIRKERAEKIVGKTPYDNAAEKLNIVVNKLTERAKDKPHLMNAVNAIKARLARFNSLDKENNPAEASSELNAIRNELENVVSGTTPVLEETPVEAEITGTGTQ